jgi:hypothetical protein
MQLIWAYTICFDVCDFCAFCALKNIIVGVQSRNKCSLGNVERKEWARSRQVAEAPCQNVEILFFKPAMGSCIKVVKQNNLV